MILSMHPANERWRYKIMSFLTGWMHIYKYIYIMIPDSWHIYVIYLPIPSMDLSLILRDSCHWFCASELMPKNMNIIIWYIPLSKHNGGWTVFIFLNLPCIMHGIHHCEWYAKVQVRKVWIPENTVTSQKHPGISNHWQTNCLFISLRRLTKKLCITAPIGDNLLMTDGLLPQSVIDSESMSMSSFHHEYCDIAWEPWCLKSLATRLFVPQFIQANKKYQAVHHCSHMILVDSPDKVTNNAKCISMP